jgi:hypothetical protein
MFPPPPRRLQDTDLFSSLLLVLQKHLDEDLPACFGRTGAGRGFRDRQIGQENEKASVPERWDMGAARSCVHDGALSQRSILRGGRLGCAAMSRCTSAIFFQYDVFFFSLFVV